MGILLISVVLGVAVCAALAAYVVITVRDDQ